MTRSDQFATHLQAGSQRQRWPERLNAECQEPGYGAAAVRPDARSHIPKSALCVTGGTGRVDGHIERAGVDCQCQAAAVSDADSAVTWDCCSPVAGIGNRDTGQITVGMRNRHRHFPDSYMRTGMSAAGWNSGGTADPLFDGELPHAARVTTASAKATDAAPARPCSPFTTGTTQGTVVRLPTMLAF